MSTPKEELESMFDASRDAGETLEVDLPEPDVIDTDDGGAIVRLGGEAGPVEMSEFYTNLLNAPDVPITQLFLDSLATDLIETIELDIQSREGRDQQYEEGLKRTGIGQDAPGGAQFQGAAKTAHPMLTKACVDFAARAIKELYPPAGPVKSFIPGTPTKQRLEKAERKQRHMNWQLVHQIQEFRPSLEQLLSQVPMAGVQYQRWIYVPRKKRAVPAFVPVDKYIIPFAAADFYTAERRTFIDDITEFELKQRVSDGIYTDDSILVAALDVPTPTRSEEATQKIEGKQPGSENRDGLRRFYETEAMLDISEWDEEAQGEARPYIIRIDVDSRKIRGIVRNWEMGDEKFIEMVWGVEWPFIPWRGSMPIGIAQMVSGLSGAATGALRALLDSAHINNIPTLVKLKGSGQGGQTITLDPTKIEELEGPMGADDIRKVLMAIPFNEPSLVLFQLLGFLVKEGESVVRTTFEDLAEQKQDMPVGTTLALIEQGMAVMSAIHGRLFASMQRTLSVLHRINRMYAEDEDIRNDTGELLARASDYDGPEDVIPVADPRIFSDVQRFAQMQVIADRAEKRPALYNQRRVELLILERLKFPNPEQLLVAAPDPKELNAVNENVAASLGRPVTAFPEQDHLAHIQVHLDFMNSPFFGLLQPIMTRLYPAMVQHLVEHIVLWYASRVYEHASAAAGQDFAELLKLKDPETRKEIDRTVAMASMAVIEEANTVLRTLPPIIGQAMQAVQALQQAQQPQDPTAAGKIATEQVRGRNQQQLEQQRQQGKQMEKQAEMADSAEERRERTAQRLQELKLRVIEGQRDSGERAAERDSDMQREQFQQSAESQRAHESNMTKIATNTEDNKTALTIAAAEIDSAENVAVSTGTGINPGADK